MRYLGKTLMTGIWVGFIIAFVFIGIQVLMGRSISFDAALLQEIGYYFLFSIVLTLVNASYFDYINRKVVWKKYREYRMLIAAIGGIAITMLTILWLRILIRMGFEGADWQDFLDGERAAYYIIALLITIVVSVFFHAAYFYRSIQDRRVKEQKIIAGTASAKFDALKNQLDPHFLFNSLNVLTSLIEEDSQQAQKFTTSLSKVYRYVLEQKNKELVSVEEELQFAKTYVRLLKMRFEDSIVLDLPETTSNPEAKIVPLSLQLLLENAVKHNVVTSTKPLKIRVYEEDGFLVVTNNLQEKQVLKKSSGVGLRNIHQRYNLLTDKTVRIDKKAQDFSVYLPMLTKQVSTMKTQDLYIKDKRYQKAKEKVEAIKGFYGNLLAYCIVIPFLAWLNLRTTGFPWVVFPMLGWGLGVVLHGMEVYGYNPLWGKRWEERKLKELMEQEDF
ncbi:MAG: 2TM domain-containing protein [Flavobacteriaceae bacterium]